MTAVREGWSSRAKRPNKPRTISDKLEIYERDIAPKLRKRIIYDVTEDDLINLVQAKGKTAKVPANRLEAELKVFFGWAASLRGKEMGLDVEPASHMTRSIGQLGGMTGAHDTDRISVIGGGLTPADDGPNHSFWRDAKPRQDPLGFRLTHRWRSV